MSNSSAMRRNRARIARLSSATGTKRRTIELDPTTPRVDTDYDGREPFQIGFPLAEKFGQRRKISGTLVQPNCAEDLWYRDQATMTQNSHIVPANLKACPDRPNCVSSQATVERQWVEPFPHRSDSDIETLGTLLEAMNGSRVVTLTQTYIHAEFRSRIFRFVDDLEILLDEDQGVLQIRSASRLGYSDLGANRERVETLRALYLGTRA